jgi:hypothetical protein
MRQVLLDKSLLLLAKEVRMSASRKSAQLTCCAGTNTRPSVLQKKALEGLLSTFTGINISTAAAPYISGGMRIAAAVAVEPLLAHRDVLDARHVAAKHTSTRAKPYRSLLLARRRLSASE